ncbi:MAG: 5-methylcytosine-specific restriction endonuclease system specificity protein McrC [Alteromonadaceae bacterium]|uniref:5-methylcytosine-specific restriction endonuclease system specificity protein McrC n=1 Tax=unclassified Methylophaga TaxID=2629249 RepID=UPI000C6533FB|nr:MULTISPECIES: 5-methylcytosine-specific restriction endonuclease system specificity protein McrC [unclassified Methylophaga]MAP26889.1 5-methylcytosine-specific restriction endonuclease system specificity protein McrC [Methylophaga sp.]MBN25986.1 5-methylcytosine-specific restriction endonuclease system specificity protein McrC [Alteromonadaceae bacterium]
MASNLTYQSLSDGFIGKIPVRNIWLLMLYASDLYRAYGIHYFDVEENPDDIPELVAEVLCRSLERRLKQSLTPSYHNTEQILSRVRGRIDHLKTIRRQLLLQGKVACQFEELTQDTPRNRYIKKACRLLARVTKKQTARRLLSLNKSMERLGVSNDPFPEYKALSPLARHERHDAMMLSAARLAHNLALPTEITGYRALPIAAREEHWARQLFEKSMAGFFYVHLTPQGWSVSRGQVIHWPVSVSSEGADIYLPRMQTDIVLEKKELNQRIIIDTKFTSVLTKNHHGQDRFKREYLFQLYSYLKSQESSKDLLSMTSKGLFLHPAVDGHIDEYFTVQNHPIRFLTVDLAADAISIKHTLVSVLDCP